MTKHNNTCDNCGYEEHWHTKEGICMFRDKRDWKYKKFKLIKEKKK